MPETNLATALDQINEIHSHMARSQIYRGYRPLPVALSGVVGLLAAWLQPAIINVTEPSNFVFYWLSVAGICALLAASAVSIHYLRQLPYERRQIFFVWGQFIPCLVAGGLVGITFARISPETIPMLPGIWAIIFSLGIFSSRPFLPRITGWVALYYLVAGIWLLQEPASPSEPAWRLATVFAIGQCAGALMLYLKLERTSICVD